jgi:hypothetical protein
MFSMALVAAAVPIVFIGGILTVVVNVVRRANRAGQGGAVRRDGSWQQGQSDGLAYLPDSALPNPGYTDGGYTDHGGHHGGHHHGGHHDSGGSSWSSGWDSGSSTSSFDSGGGGHHHG